MLRRIAILMLFMSLGGFSILAVSQVSDIEYSVVIAEYEKQVYDGDTLRDVHIKVVDMAIPEEKRGTPWPGLLLDVDGVYAQTNVRIAGIDTPETRPRKKWRDGTDRPESVRDAERAAAKQARQALIGLISNADGVVLIKNPQFGKFAGRVVANLYVKGADENLIDVSQYMIENGHAYPYDGGERKEFPW